MLLEACKLPKKVFFSSVFEAEIALEELGEAAALGQLEGGLNANDSAEPGIDPDSSEASETTGCENAVSIPAEIEQVEESKNQTDNCDGHVSPRSSSSSA